MPYYKFEKHRNILRDWTQKLETRDMEAENGWSDTGLQAYWAEANCTSLDGLPGMELAIRLSASPEAGAGISTWFRPPPPKESKEEASSSGTKPQWWKWENGLGLQFGVGVLVGVTVATLLHKASLAR